MSTGIVGVVTTAAAKTYPLKAPQTSVKYLENSYVLYPGVYTLDFEVGPVFYADFYYQNSYVTSVAGASGLNFALTQNVDRILFYVTDPDGSANTIFIRLVTESALPTPIGGTFQAITTSQTFSGTGFANIILVGGGSSGGFNAGYYDRYAGPAITAGGQVGGGGTGFVTYGRTTLTNNMPVVIGAGGLARNTNGVNAGGTTTFAGFSAAGAYSSNHPNNGQIGGANGGTGWNGGWNAGGYNGETLTLNTVHMNFAGTIGAGGPACTNPNIVGAYGSLGTGGTGSRPISINDFWNPARWYTPTAGTGVGSGGGGSWWTNFPAGAGAPGAVYLLKFT